MLKINLAKNEMIKLGDDVEIWRLAPFWAQGWGASHCLS